jgi:uncharacterized membrane protein YGL010W
MWQLYVSALKHVICIPLYSLYFWVLIHYTVIYSSNSQIINRNHLYLQYSRAPVFTDSASTVSVIRSLLQPDKKLDN